MPVKGDQNDNKGESMTVKKFLESTYTDERFQVRPAVGCKDGLTLSIQGGSSSHYCSPAEKCNIYEAVEE
jgi:hypothetical protein